jgi:hypothetical protein
MIVLPTDEEIHELIKLENKHGDNAEFAEMCLIEGAKLLRDILKERERE